MDWTGAAWGVAWRNFGSGSAAVNFHTVTPTGPSVGPRTEPFLVEGRLPGPVSISWANDRFLLAYYDSDPGHLKTGIINRYGYSPWGSFETDLDATDHALARFVAGETWVVVARLRNSEGSIAPVVAATVGEDGKQVGGQWQLGNGRAGVAAVGLKNRVLAAWASEDGLAARAFSLPDIEASHEVLVLKSADNVGVMAAAPFRDGAVIATVDATTLRTVAFDPYGQQVTDGPHEVAAVGHSQSAVGIGAAENEGYLGICYARGSQGDATLVFRLLGEDGRPRSPEHAVVVGRELISGCSVGYSGRYWAVAWWSTASDDGANAVNVQLLEAGPG